MTTNPTTPGRRLRPIWIAALCLVLAAPWDVAAADGDGAAANLAVGSALASWSAPSRREHAERPDAGVASWCEVEDGDDLEVASVGRELGRDVDFAVRDPLFASGWHGPFLIISTWWRTPTRCPLRC